MTEKKIIEVERERMITLKTWETMKEMTEVKEDRKMQRKIQRMMVRKMKQKKRGGKLTRRKTSKDMINVTTEKEEMVGKVEIVEIIEGGMGLREMVTEKMIQRMIRVRTEEAITEMTTEEKMINVGMAEGI